MLAFSAPSTGLPLSGVEGDPSSPSIGAIANSWVPHSVAVLVLATAFEDNGQIQHQGYHTRQTPTGDQCSRINDRQARNFVFYGSYGECSDISVSFHLSSLEEYLPLEPVTKWLQGPLSRSRLQAGQRLVDLVGCDCDAIWNHFIHSAMLVPLRRGLTCDWAPWEGVCYEKKFKIVNGSSA